jgi:hypothetical protein
VPETQLISVSGGERIPLFTKAIRQQAKDRTIDLNPAPPLAPPTPHTKYAAMAVHVWPSLHSLIPGATPHDIPEVFDTGALIEDKDDGFECTTKISTLMQHGLFRLREFMPADQLDPAMTALAEYMEDRKSHCMSHFDGGQLMYNFIFGDKAVLFNSHLGAYEGILRSLEPKPDVVMLGAGGRPNLNGRPYAGTAAEFMTKEVEWLGQPAQVYFCLHDERFVILSSPDLRLLSFLLTLRSFIKPYRVDTKAAEAAIKKATSSAVTVTEVGKTYSLFA